MMEFFKAEMSGSMAMGGGDTPARGGGSTLKAAALARRDCSQPTSSRPSWMHVALLRREVLRCGVSCGKSDSGVLFHSDREI